MGMGSWVADISYWVRASDTDCPNQWVCAAGGGAVITDKYRFNGKNADSAAIGLIKEIYNGNRINQEIYQE